MCSQALSINSSGLSNGLRLAFNEERKHAGSSETCSLLQSNKSVLTTALKPGSRRPLPFAQEISNTRAFMSKTSSKRFFQEDIPTNAEVVFVMPFFVIIVCMFCAVGFYNICRDDLLDELHANGVDVIRSEDGGLKSMPQPYEY